MLHNYPGRRNGSDRPVRLLQERDSTLHQNVRLLMPLRSSLGSSRREVMFCRCLRLELHPLQFCFYQKLLAQVFSFFSWVKPPGSLTRIPPYCCCRRWCVGCCQVKARGRRRSCPGDQLFSNVQLADDFVGLISDVFCGRVPARQNQPGIHIHPSLVSGVSMKTNGKS